MLHVTGIATAEDIAKVTPPAERLSKGPCAMVECYQKIPCNPCATSCPFGAFTKDNDINELPVIDYTRCTGCGVCVSHCPGLAIFIVDLSGEGDQGVVRIPYEMLPLPEEGEQVQGLGRDGSTVCSARVQRVQNAANQDRTPIIWLEVPKAHVMDVRHFQRL